MGTTFITSSSAFRLHRHHDTIRRVSQQQTILSQRTTTSKRQCARMQESLNDDENFSMSPSESQKDRAYRNAIRALIDDHIKSSRNICIGDARPDLLLPLLDAIDVHAHATTLSDVAFIATTPENQQLLNERKLPADLSVNFKPGIDLFVAPTAVVDSELNVVLESKLPAMDIAAASLAKECVFVIHEDDMHNCCSSFPIQLNSFLPSAAARSLQDDESLRSLGVSSVSLRPGSSNSGNVNGTTVAIADVQLEKDALASVIRDELKRFDTVSGIGLLKASEKNTIIVAQSSGEPVDMTAVQSTLGSKSKDMKKAAVSESRCAGAVSALKGWRLIDGSVKSIAASLKFSDVVRADTFVRSVHELARVSNHHPEIRQNFSQVRICLSTYEAGGVSELDILFAKQLSKIHDVMTSSRK